MAASVIGNKELDIKYGADYVNTNVADDANYIIVESSKPINFEDGIMVGGEHVSSVAFEPILTTGTQIATVSIDGNETTLYAPAGGGSGSLENIVDGSATGSARSVGSSSESSSYTMGLNAIALGENSKASGRSSFTEGGNNTSSGDYSHSEGYMTTASGLYSHAEGNSTDATSQGTHAEGYQTVAAAQGAHAEGYSTTSAGTGSHSEGSSTKALAQGAHSEGYMTIASGNYSHAENRGTYATGWESHAEGEYSVASGNQSHAEGYGTTTNKTLTYLEAGKWTVTGDSTNYIGTIVEYQDTAYKITSATYDSTNNLTTLSVAITGEAGDTISAKFYNHFAGSQGAHTEGYNQKNNGSMAHAEGQNNELTCVAGHVEGTANVVKGQNNNHGEGTHNNIIGTSSFSHVEGEYNTIDSCSGSHVEGAYNSASSTTKVHVEGFHNIANHRSQHVFGEYNIADTSTASGLNKGTYVEIVGNGTSDNARSNARTLDWYGNETLAGNLNVGGTLTVSGSAVVAPVQSDWNQTDTSALDYIKHKPTVQTVSVTRDLTSGTKIATITIDNVGTDLYAPTGGGGGTQVQADWSQTDPSDPSYILNKPTALSDFTNDLGFIDNSVNNLTNYTLSSNLSTVATSGSYNDLTNKPTIPDAVTVTQVQSTGTKIATITVGSTGTDIYAPTGGGVTEAYVKGWVGNASITTSGQSHWQGDDTFLTATPTSDFTLNISSTSDSVLADRFIEYAGSITSTNGGTLTVNLQESGASIVWMDGSSASSFTIGAGKTYVYSIIYCKTAAKAYGSIHEVGHTGGTGSGLTMATSASSTPTVNVNTMTFMSSTSISNIILTPDSHDTMASEWSGVFTTGTSQTSVTFSWSSGSPTINWASSPANLLSNTKYAFSITGGVDFGFIGSIVPLAY